MAAPNDAEHHQSEQVKRAGCGGALLVAIAAVLLARGSLLRKPMVENKIPVVTAHVGAPIAEAIRTAGLKLDYTKHYDDAPVAIDYPVKLHYSDPEHPFDLPPARFVFLPQSAGIITGVETSPVLMYVDLHKAHEVALELMETLERAGWLLTQSYPTDYAAVEGVFRDNSLKPKIERLYGEWRLGTVTADIYVKKRRDVEAQFEGRDPKDLYLPSIDIFDPVLREELTKKVYERRQQKTGDFNRSLPLSAWVNEAR
jgi:hypothetical protein